MTAPACAPTVSPAVGSAGGADGGSAGGGAGAGAVLRVGVVVCSTTTPRMEVSCAGVAAASVVNAACADEDRNWVVDHFGGRAPLGAHAWV